MVRELGAQAFGMERDGHRRRTSERALAKLAAVSIATLPARLVTAQIR